VAVSDHPTVKKIDVASVSGTPTVDKAQPVICAPEQGFSLSDYSFSGTSFDISGRTTRPQEIEFNDDGTKFYTTNSGSGLVEYDLGSAYDLSTASFNQEADFSGTVGSEQITGIAFSDTGDKLFLLTLAESIYEFDLSNSFDISTASSVQSIGAPGTSTEGLTFNDDGTIIYNGSNGDDTVRSTFLSTGYNLTSPTTGNTLDASGEVGDLEDVNFSQDGTKAFVVHQNGPKVFQYDLSTAFDLSTGSYSGNSFDFGTEDNSPYGIAFNPTGTVMFMVGDTGEVYEYAGASGTEAKTGTGDVIYDSSTVSGPEDVGFYDENGNLLDYEIENDADVGSGTFTAWVYGSWVRDGSTQLQFAYGDNSTSTDRQNVSGTWNNSGQDAQAVYHYDESSSPATDSTSNNRDSKSTTGTNFKVNGDLGAAREFDGTDDQVEFDYNGLGFDVISVVAYIKPDSWDTSNLNHVVDAEKNNNNVNSHILRQNNGNFEWFINNGSFEGLSGTLPNTGEFSQIGGTFDTSGNLKYYLNGSQDASKSTSSGLASYSIVSHGARGGSQADDRNFDGIIDEVRYYSGVKPNEWWQADADATPAEGQVFFSQQAAESTTTTTQTINLNTSTAQGTAPNPTVTGTGAASVSVQPSTSNSNAPSLQATGTGTTNVNIQSGTTSTNTPEPQFSPGTVTLQIQESTAQATSPTVGITASEVINIGSSTAQASSPGVQVQATGTTTVQVQESSAEAGSPGVEVLRAQKISVGSSTASASVPEPEVSGTGTVTVQVEESVAQAAVPTTEIRASNRIEIVSPTKATITTPRRFAFMDSQTFKQGDTGDTLRVRLTDENGKVNVSNTTVKFLAEDRTGNQVLNENMTVVDGPNGEVKYEWQEGDFIEDPGVYQAEFKIIDDTSKPETFPNKGKVDIEIEEEIN
jgi:hypothetical protein